MNLRENRSYRKEYRKEDIEDYNRFFKKKDQNNKFNKPSVISFNIEQQNFPVLINNTTQNNDNNNKQNVQSFAEMASLPKIVETVIEEVPPGKLSIWYDKQSRTIKSKYGAKTPDFILYETREKVKNSLHYRMNKAIYQINKNQEKYIQYYDDVHGEGAYEEMFQKYMYDLDDDDDVEEIPSDDSEPE